MHCCYGCRLYQCNVCGEGGEYESLVLDCPLFKQACIVLDKWDTVLHSPDSFAPVGLLHPVAFHLEPKGQPGAFCTSSTGQSDACHSDSADSNPESAVSDTQSVLHQTKAMSQPSAAVLADPAQRNSQNVMSQAAADAMLAASIVVEVPTELPLNMSDGAHGSHTHSLSAQHSAADWQTDVQLHSAADYTRAVCCPQQQNSRESSSEATATALDAALAAISQGMLSSTPAQLQRLAYGLMV